MDDRKAIEVEVTKEMIDAGIGEFMDYELGGMTAGDMVKNVFASMLSVSRLGNTPESIGFGGEFSNVRNRSSVRFRASSRGSNSIDLSSFSRSAFGVSLRLVMVGNRD